MFEELACMQPKLHAFNYLQCPAGLYRKLTAPMPYFLYVHTGKGRFIVANTEYDCKPGDLFFCPYGVPNTIIADQRDPYLLSGVEFELQENMPALPMPPMFVPRFNIRDNAQFMWITMELVGCMANVAPGIEAYANALFKAWMLLVAGIVAQPRESALAETIAEYLASRLQERVTLRELSARFQYHANHINRVFKKRYGVPLIAYQENLRIREALRLLSYSQLSVGEIACACGFHDANYFSRIFKQKTGRSPTDYRRPPDVERNT